MLKLKIYLYLSIWFTLPTIYTVSVNWSNTILILSDANNKTMKPYKGSTAASLFSQLGEATAISHTSPKTVENGSWCRVISPGSKRNNNCSSIVFWRVLQCLVCQGLSCFCRIWCPLNHITDLLIRHDTVDAIRCQNQKSIPTMPQLKRIRKSIKNDLVSYLKFFFLPQTV